MESFEVWSNSIGMRRGPSALKVKNSRIVKRALKLLVRRQRAAYAQVLRARLVLSSDRHFIAKAKRVRRMYLHSPKDTIVLCVDEEPMQILERKHPRHNSGKDARLGFEYEYWARHPIFVRSLQRQNRSGIWQFSAEKSTCRVVQSSSQKSRQ